MKNIVTSKFSKIGFLLAALTVGSFTTSLPAHAFSLTGDNLITNGDAEVGSGSATGNDVVPVPGWMTTGNFTVVQYGTSGGFPTSSDPGPQNRGQNFFAGGSSNSSSSASQLIDVSTGATTIDSGQVTYNLSGYLGGYDSQDDNAVLTAKFLNQDNLALGQGVIGPVTLAARQGETGLLLQNTSGIIPTGTRKIDLELVMTREQGDYNDGYADNLSLSLNSAPAPSSASSPSVPAPSSGSLNSVPEPSSALLNTLALSAFVGIALALKSKHINNKKYLTGSQGDGAVKEV